eukprot:Em0003g673a
MSEPTPYARDSSALAFALTRTKLSLPYSVEVSCDLEQFSLAARREARRERSCLQDSKKAFLLELTCSALVFTKYLTECTAASGAVNCSFCSEDDLSHVRPASNAILLCCYQMLEDIMLVATGTLEVVIMKGMSVYHHIITLEEEKQAAGLLTRAISTSPDKGFFCFASADEMLHHSDEKIAGLQHVLEHIGYKVGVSNRWSDGDRKGSKYERRVLMEYEAKKDSYWTSDNFLQQIIKKAADIADLKYPPSEGVKTILGLNVQGGNSVKSMLFYPGFVEKPMLKYEYNYYLNMVFVRQNQGRTISIPTLDAQSQDGFSTIPTLDAQSQDGFSTIPTLDAQSQDGFSTILTLDAQSQDGFSTILTLDAQSQDGFSTISALDAQSQDGSIPTLDAQSQMVLFPPWTLNPRMGFTPFAPFQDGFLLKTSLKIHAGRL